MKVKNRLLNFGDNVIFQDDEAFLFSLDSVILANFVSIRLTDKNIVDLCSGNAPIPMLLSFRTKANILGVELQKYIYDLGYESIISNKMDKQISFVNYDIKNLVDEKYEGKYDVVTCNPPYFKYKEGSLINQNKNKMIARHEVCTNLEEVIKISSYILKTNGTMALVHRPERLMEILFLMRKYNIEPKKMRFVYPKEDRDANMVLIEGSKNGKIGLRMLAPLIIYNNNGDYTEEVRKMFGSD
jgi:methyltransferase (ubiE/COQ5 family)